MKTFFLGGGKSNECTTKIAEHESDFVFFLPMYLNK